jgi:hypothetical protein
MRRVSPILLLSLWCIGACGGPTAKPKSPDDIGNATDGGETDAAVASADAGAASTPSPCTGSDIDLLNALIQSACEVKNIAPDAKLKDVSALLDVKVSPSSNTVPPGGHLDVLVTFTNKSKDPLPLDFLLDPTPRFSIEVYNSKNARAEMPKTKPPKVKNEGPAPDPTAAGTAEVTIPPGGKAWVKLPFDAVRLKWAPEKVKGTPPELGFPTSPAGPLLKGSYLLKVVTPLVGVFEGAAHDVSSPKATIAVK